VFKEPELLSMQGSATVPKLAVTPPPVETIIVRLLRVDKFED
jgi:hypothetical protein